MSPMMWRICSVVVIVASPFAVAGLIGLYDYAAFTYGGNEATISRVWLEWNQAFPILSAAFVGACCLGVGIAYGHFFVPQHVQQQIPNSKGSPMNFNPLVLAELLKVGSDILAIATSGLTEAQVQQFIVDVKQLIADAKNQPTGG